MGQVWRGAHAEQGVPVAVKVLCSRVARNPEFRDGFMREVQAMAALDHPGICHVFDYGVISAQAAAEPLAQQERLQQGDPWLAMELASHGSLDRQPPMRTWSRLRRCLLEILDALAHAHARGIVHRDLKPGNVLVCADERGVRRYVLTDFGLAHALDPAVSSSTANIHASLAGTPHYMPPEQLQGQWRDYGPWTDLYALGCMAHELCCGQPPFHADSFIRLAALHLDAPPPALTPRFPVPAGLGDWIHRLMAKDWSHRYACAADAAWALMQLSLDDVHKELEAAEPDEAERAAYATLPTLDELAQTIAGQPSLTPQTLMLDATHIDDLALSDQHRAQRRPARLFESRLIADDTQHVDDVSGRGVAELRDVPPMPPTWRAGEGGGHVRRSPRLIGAGLGLFSLREVPFVGRLAERDQLWTLLGEVRAAQRAQLVVVRGPAGTGKSRLIEWFASRAQELGACQLLRANHQTIPGPMHGLTPALQAALHAINLPRPEVYTRVLAMLERHGVGGSPARRQDLALAITELARTGAPQDDGLPLVSFSSPAERHAMWRRVLGYFSRQRPVLLWLDDVQWGEESLGLAESLASAPFDAAVLVVMTARDEALETLPDIARRLSALPGVYHITLGPLPDDAHNALVQDMLTLDPALSRQLAERTRGNPLFARQLLSDWVERGLLEATPTGFALRAGVSQTLPASIQSLLLMRVARIEAERPGTQRLLEYAATLGQEVSQAELVALCRVAGLVWPLDLDDLLVERGLAQRRQGGWAFVHGLLHESLLTAAQEAGRLAALHRHAAQMLAQSANATLPEVLERRGKHLMAAGADEEASGLLWAAMTGFHRTSAYARALAVLELRDEALARLGVEETDARRVSAWPYRAELVRFMGQMEQAEVWSARAVEATASMPRSTPRADALRVRATYLWAIGAVAESSALNLEAQAVYTQLHDHHGLVQALHGYGWLMLATRRYAEALETFERGAALAERAGDVRNQAWCIQGIADLASRLRRTRSAEAHATQAAALFARIGARAGAALSRATIADAMRQRGELEGALALYLEARELWQETGSSLAGLASLRIAQVQLARGEVEAARAQLIELEAQVQLNNFVLKLGKFLCELSLAAHDGDAARWDGVWAQVEALRRAGLVDHADVADGLRLCAALWRVRGDAARAAQADALADEVAQTLAAQLLPSLA
jgi:serine/threonine protein kinase/tetratricopeptide (TPR) repeat protein